MVNEDQVRFVVNRCICDLEPSMTAELQRMNEGDPPPFLECQSGELLL